MRDAFRTVLSPTRRLVLNRGLLLQEDGNLDFKEPAKSSDSAEGSGRRPRRKSYGNRRLFPARIDISAIRHERHKKPAAHLTPTYRSCAPRSPTRQPRPGPRRVPQIDRASPATHTQGDRLRPRSQHSKAHRVALVYPALDVATSTRPRSHPS